RSSVPLVRPLILPKRRRCARVGRWRSAAVARSPCDVASLSEPDPGSGRGSDRSTTPGRGKPPPELPAGDGISGGRRALTAGLRRAYVCGAREARTVKLSRYVTQLLKGNTDVLILSTLEREPMYGHQILEAIEQASGGTLAISEGTLYPALQRLTREGRIRPRWTTLPSG